MDKLNFLVGQLKTLQEEVDPLGENELLLEDLKYSCLVEAEKLEVTEVLEHHGDILNRIGQHWVVV